MRLKVLIQAGAILGFLYLTLFTKAPLCRSNANAVWVCTCGPNQCKQGGTWQLWGRFFAYEWQECYMGTAKQIRTQPRSILSLLADARGAGPRK